MFAVIAILCLALSSILALTPYMTGIAVIAAVVVFIVCFVNTEASLYLLILSMLLSPEIGMGGLADPSGATVRRGVTIRTEDLLLLVMCFAWLVRSAVHKDLGLIRSTPLNGPIAWYTLACIFATGMGFIYGYVNGVTGIFYVLKYIEFFVVYFIVANNIESRDRIWRLTVVMLATALVISLIAIAQIPSGGRVTAPFEGERAEPNTLGGYLLFIGCITSGLLLGLRDRMSKMLLAGLLVLMFVPFLATLSRGSFLALPVASIALASLKRRARFGMIAVFVLLAAIGTVAMPQVVKDRIMYTFNQGETSHHQVQIGNVRLDSSTSARLDSWGVAVSDWADSPVWGYGITGYAFLDAQYFRILAETGIVGAVTFIALIVAVYRQGFGLYHATTDPLYFGLSIGLISGLTALLVHGISANTFAIVRIMEPFWLFAGLVVSCARIESGAVVTVDVDDGDSASA
jgi:O-antigen ligase